MQASKHWEIKTKENIPGKLVWEESTDTVNCIVENKSYFTSHRKGFLLFVTSFFNFVDLQRFYRDTTPLQLKLKNNQNSTFVVISFNDLNSLGNFAEFFLCVILSLHMLISKRISINGIYLLSTNHQPRVQYKRLQQLKQLSTLRLLSLIRRECTKLTPRMINL